jgi:hypothetical protein
VNPLANRQHDVAPVCSGCGCLMTADWRRSDTAPAPRARVGNPPPPRLTVSVWRCTNCSIDRPRLQ